jgi:hypothetical protein
MPSSPTRRLPCSCTRCPPSSAISTTAKPSRDSGCLALALNPSRSARPHFSTGADTQASGRRLEEERLTARLARDLQAVPRRSCPDGGRALAHSVVVVGFQSSSRDSSGSSSRRTRFIVLRELGIRSAMILPTQARERTIGAPTLVTAESRTFDQDDLTFAHDAARRRCRRERTALPPARVSSDLRDRAPRSGKPGDVPRHAFTGIGPPSRCVRARSR